MLRGEMLRGESKARNLAAKAAFIQRKVLHRSSVNEKRGRSCVGGVLQLWGDANTLPLSQYFTPHSSLQDKQTGCCFNCLIWHGLTLQEVKEILNTHSHPHPWTNWAVTICTESACSVENTFWPDANWPVLESAVSFCAPPARKVKGGKKRGRREGGDCFAPSTLPAACSTAHLRQADPQAARCGLSSRVSGIVLAVTNIFRGKCWEGDGRKCWSDSFKSRALLSNRL